MTSATTTRPVARAPPRDPPTRSLPSVLRHSATLAWRGILKTVHSTEALLDVTLQPVIFLLLFVYVFGGAIAGDTAPTCSTRCPACSCRRSCSPRPAPAPGSRTT